MAEKGAEIEQLGILEEKVNALINLIGALRKEKEALTETIQVQNRKINDLTADVEQLTAGRNEARGKIVSLLERIESLDI